MFKSLFLTMVLFCGVFAQDNVFDSRLVKVSGEILDRINITTDDSITVKAQALKRNAKGDITWMDVPIKWEVREPMGPIVDSSTSKDLNIPDTISLTWTINPKKSFQGYLNFIVGNKPSTKQINIAEALPSKAVFIPLTPLDSIFVGKPVKIIVYVENRDGIKPERWSGLVSLLEVFTSKTSILKDTAICFQAKKLDTILATPSSAGTFKYKIVITDAFKVDTICDSIISFSVLSNASSTSLYQPIINKAKFNIRITTGQSGIILDCLKPFSGQVVSMDGRIVTRFSNVKSYALTSSQVPAGKYILQASTKVNSPMQRIITLFQ